MNSIHAKIIAKTITNDQIKAMFDAAKEGITDWEKRSAVNKGMTKGYAWNILAKDFDVEKQHHYLAKKNMVWEFGDFLPDSLKIKPVKKNYGKPFHQNPFLS